MAPRPTASFTLLPGQTLWDFVALSGGEGRQGSTKTFSILGAGSVVATAVSAGVGTAFPEVYSKGFALPAGNAERGLGLCVAVAVPGDCNGGSDDEIGDPWVNVSPSLANYAPFVQLNFTGLTAGSSVVSVTLASIQPGEGWLVQSSPDGGTYSTFSSGTGNGAQLPTLEIPVPAGTKFLRILQNGAGSSGNNYLVQSVTTQAGPPSTLWCSPGYWKNHPASPPWPAGYQNLLYNSFSGLYAHAPYSFADNPTLLQVISHPSTYKGPATNNVADILSNVVFGTPIGTGVENCPLN